jgi:hypothetical protein
VCHEVKDGVRRCQMMAGGKDVVKWCLMVSGDGNW